MSDLIHSAARALANQTIALRRDFHEHPEIAFEELRTSAIVAALENASLFIIYSVHS